MPFIIPAAQATPYTPPTPSSGGRPSAALPHFDLPFRYIGVAPAVNDQDSIDDIAACVYAVAATPPGSRDEDPDFGLADQTFQQQPLNARVIAAQVSHWEPRVEVLAQEAPDVLDAAIAKVTIEVRATS